MKQRTNEQSNEITKRLTNQEFSGAHALLDFHLLLYLLRYFFLTGLSGLAQAVFLMLLLAHVHCQPYQSMELNHLETVVLSALVVTQFGCVAVRA